MRADTKLLLTATFAGFPSRAAEHAETFRRVAPEIASLLFHDPSHDRMELFGPGFLEYEAGGIGVSRWAFFIFSGESVFGGRVGAGSCRARRGWAVGARPFCGSGIIFRPVGRSDSSAWFRWNRIRRRRATWKRMCAGKGRLKCALRKSSGFWSASRSGRNWSCWIRRVRA